MTQLIEVTPKSAGWKYVGFEVHRLNGKESLECSTRDREVCVVMLTTLTRRRMLGPSSA